MGPIYQPTGSVAVILSEVFQLEFLAIIMGFLSHMSDFKNIFVERSSILHIKQQNIFNNIVRLKHIIKSKKIIN